MDRRADITLALKAWLEAGNLGLEEVFYGEANLLKKLPAAEVIPPFISRELISTSHRTQNTIVSTINIYHGRAGSQEITRQKADELAQAVVDRLHEDLTLGDRVIHSFVVTEDGGYLAKGPQTVYVGTQLEWRATSRTYLGGNNG